MKALPWMTTGALFLLLGTAAPTFAQEERKEEAKPAKEEKARPPKQEEHAKQQEHAKKEEHAKQEEHARAEEHHAPVRTREAEERQRGAAPVRVTVRTNVRIPEARFHEHFGAEHRFVIGAPRFIGGYSRFQYGGFWFGFVDPWPAGWFYTDQVYVDYVDGGYYLFNPFYPGVRVAITVVP